MAAVGTTEDPTTKDCSVKKSARVEVAGEAEVGATGRRRLGLKRERGKAE